MYIVTSRSNLAVEKINDDAPPANVKKMSEIVESPEIEGKNIIEEEDENEPISKPTLPQNKSITRKS